MLLISKRAPELRLLQDRCWMFDCEESVEQTNRCAKEQSGGQLSAAGKERQQPISRLLLATGACSFFPPSHCTGKPLLPTMTKIEKRGAIQSSVPTQHLRDQRQTPEPYHSFKTTPNAEQSDAKYTCREHHDPTPPPFATTVSLSSTSTFRLSKPLNSGLMTFASAPSSVLACLPLSVPDDEACALESCVLGIGPGPEAIAASCFLCLACGADGKLLFLSTVSTVLWKRLKSDSARTRVDSRSMVPESSLTISEHQRWTLRERCSDLPYLSTSSKCFRWAMMTSRCFSRIASAMKMWKLLL